MPKKVGWSQSVLDAVQQRKEGREVKQVVEVAIVRSTKPQPARRTMSHQLDNTVIQDAVDCFKMSRKFLYVEYDINRIVATHQSGVTVEITFK